MSAFLMKVVDIAFVLIVLTIVLSAMNYIVESVQIFIEALKKYRMRNKK